jgi:diadenosine tetraphosphate (Ap4A) HIT family hydrolase
MSCTFCDHIDDLGAIGPLLFDDDRAAVILHRDLAVRGHAMVVAKQHVENASNLELDDFLHFARVQHVAETALLEETHADRAILLKLGIQTPHLHVHIYPVANTHDRAAVMAIIDAKTREEISEDELQMFAANVRKRIARMKL